MSQMDATNNIADFTKQAKKWGTKPLQSRTMPRCKDSQMPFMLPKKNDIKMLYGVEINLVDDGVPITYNDQHIPLLDATYVILIPKQRDYLPCMTGSLNYQLLK